MKIGLTYTGTEWKHQNYIRWLTGGEERIEIVRLSVADDPDGIDNCDALVLSGGIDIDPGLYNGGGTYTKAPVGGWDRARDLFELSALRRAWDRRLPVLGVCRGLQLINISLGGTMLQDLGAEGDAIHENDKGADKRHAVKIVPGSLLAAVTGQTNGEANSAHHQAVGIVGEGLQVSCRAADGTIEGIEWSDAADKSFLLAVQWHPERMFVNGFADQFLFRSIRDRFIAEIDKTINKKDPEKGK